jgi:hypothetical protein
MGRLNEVHVVERRGFGIDGVQSSRICMSRWNSSVRERVVKFSWAEHTENSSSSTRRIFARNPLYIPSKFLRAFIHNSEFSLVSSIGRA